MTFKLETVLLDQSSRREDCVLDFTRKVTALVETSPLVPLRSRVAPPALRTHHAFPAREGCGLLNTRDIGVRHGWRGLERERWDNAARPFGALVHPDGVVSQVGVCFSVIEQEVLRAGVVQTHPSGEVNLGPKAAARAACLTRCLCDVVTVGPGQGRVFRSPPARLLQVDLLQADLGDGHATNLLGPYVGHHGIGHDIVPMGHLGGTVRVFGASMSVSLALHRCGRRRRRA